MAAQPREDRGQEPDQHQRAANRHERHRGGGRQQPAEGLWHQATDDQHGDNGGECADVEGAFQGQPHHHTSGRNTEAAAGDDEPCAFAEPQGHEDVHGLAEHHGVPQHVPPRALRFARGTRERVTTDQQAPAKGDQAQRQQDRRNRGRGPRQARMFECVADL